MFSPDRTVIPKATSSALSAAVKGKTRSAPKALLVIDGPAGSGKTTLALEMAELLKAQTVHMDDLYDGWQGIEAGVSLLKDVVLKQFFAGSEISFSKYDWTLGCYQEKETVLEESAVLVVEGCGSGGVFLAELPHILVWIEADNHERLRRGLLRDGVDLKEEWLQFMLDEQIIYQQNNTKERADFRLNGFSEIIS